MRLGLNLAYWSTGGEAADLLALAREADRLGYAVAWTAEAYGSDCVSTLAWVAAQTERIDIGSAILQIPARSAAMTAMTAASLDTLSAGRFRLGLGVSGPQVSEGWHGVRYDAPLGRTREYVDVVKMALRRERVVYDGAHLQLPLPDGPGKALKLIVHPVREHVPIYLAAVGPKNLELCGEIADGWLAIFYSARHAGEQLGAVERGAKTAGKDGLAGFDVVPTVPISVGEDIAACAEPLRGYAALYVGGMGSREKNFYNALARRYGYDEAAQQIQDRYLARDYSGAMAAVPLDFLDETALLGPVDRIAERMTEYAESGVTTLSVSPTASDLEGRLVQLRQAVDALDKAGIGE
ncbi:MAG TPA: LLM class F420-dependent oxidoreductase [Mycobacteriales bacterium]|nr:LLM class F420-dependent oxidoreductase [Mycobacteriales bacterium]